MGRTVRSRIVMNGNPDGGERQVDAKRILRDSMRRMRRELPDRERRSAIIADHLVALPALAAASRVMAYKAVLGEVDPVSVVGWLRARGVDVRMPEDDVSPDWPDAIIVPGTAFTLKGQRLGQGGGWYDRFLQGRRKDALTIGIGFEPQVVDIVPTDVHDIELDCIVSEVGPTWTHRRTTP
ncbi:MAG: 5-formyltetrahydrofolate cyclo-ligase [Ilumatobacter sp.]|nr:5-formyltetrahydrofolate cyclo-ligase [Ilumatobacter sp.]